MSDITLREPRANECDALSALCLRSKAHWGYDEAFMLACRDELSVTPKILAERYCLLAEGDDLLGYVEVSIDDGECYLEKLFVEPSAMGGGIGRRLIEAAQTLARGISATEMIVDADPDAAPFYRKFGATDAGEVPSGSIPGRSIPRLILAL